MLVSELEKKPDISTKAANTANSNPRGASFKSAALQHEFEYEL